MDCIFCKIANGEIPSASLYEDDEFKVILDMGPLAKGHALLIPKEHVANLYEASDEMVSKAFRLARRMALKMTDALGCDGFNIIQNNNEAAGQTVFHLHIHLIPRYKGGEDCIVWKHGELDDAQREEVLSKMAGQE